MAKRKKKGKKEKLHLKKKEIKHGYRLKNIEEGKNGSLSTWEQY